MRLMDSLHNATVDVDTGSGCNGSKGAKGGVEKTKIYYLPKLILHSENKNGLPFINSVLTLAIKL